MGKFRCTFRWPMELLGVGFLWCQPGTAEIGLGVARNLSFMPGLQNAPSHASSSLPANPKEAAMPMSIKGGIHFQGSALALNEKPA